MAPPHRSRVPFRGDHAGAHALAHPDRRLARFDPRGPSHRLRRAHARRDEPPRLRRRERNRNAEARARRARAPRPGGLARVRRRARRGQRLLSRGNRRRAALQRASCRVHRPSRKARARSDPLGSSNPRSRPHCVARSRASYRITSTGFAARTCPPVPRRSRSRQPTRAGASCPPRNTPIASAAPSSAIGFRGSESSASMHARLGRRARDQSDAPSGAAETSEPASIVGSFFVHFEPEQT